MDIVRLLDDDTEPTARALVRHGLDEQPPEGALDRALSGLGLVGMAAGAAAGAAGGALGTSASGAGTGSLVSAATIAKFVVGGALVGTVAAGGAMHVLSSRAPAPAPVAPAAARVAPPPRAPSRVRAVAVATAKPEAPRAPHQEVARRAKALSAPLPLPPAPAPAPSAAAFPVSPEDALKAEVALIDRARAALARGDTSEALMLLARHQKQYPSGALTPEAFVLELTTLERAGRGDVARARARAWLATHPDGDYADRIRKIVAE